jgi:hypothetical protein
MATATKAANRATTTTTASLLVETRKSQETNEVAMATLNPVSSFSLLQKFGGLRSTRMEVGVSRGREVVLAERGARRKRLTIIIGPNYTRIALPQLGPPSVESGHGIQVINLQLRSVWSDEGRVNIKGRLHYPPSYVQARPGPGYYPANRGR